MTMDSLGTIDSAVSIAYSVAVIDDDPRVRTILAMHLGDMARAASFPNLSVLDNKTAPGVPMVVVLGPSFAEPDALGAAVSITGSRPELIVGLVAGGVSPPIPQQAQRSGVSGFLLLEPAPRQPARAG